MRGGSGPKKITFKDFADEYFEAWKDKCKPSTAKTERTRIDGVLKAYFGNWQIHTISRKEIETFLRKRRDGSLVGIVAKGSNYERKANVTQATVNLDLCRLKNMFKYAVNWGYLKENPASGIKQTKEKIEPADYLDVDEVRLFLDSAEPVYRPIFVTAVYTGLRFGEIMRLAWCDVLWDFNRISVRDPKNSEDRYVPMHEAVKEVLEGMIPKGTLKEDLKESDLILFANPRTGRPFVDVRHAMRRALKKAGIDRAVRFHDLRHTTGSHLAMSGATEREIAEVLGHKNTIVTRRYSHLSPHHTHSVVSRLDFSKKKQKGTQKAGV